VQGVSVGREPHFGPKAVHPTLGLCTIGAAPWIVNFNMLIHNVSFESGTLIPSAG
jgi:glutamate formiminotransferase